MMAKTLVPPADARSGGRAVSRALGIVAVCAAVALSSSGCTSLGAASGAAAAVSTGLVTANPAVGIGVGIAVQAATDAAIARFMKSMHADQQLLIAETAGKLQEGETAAWNVDHTLPLENGHGKVRLLRVFPSALTECREFAFSVQDGDEKADPEVWYIATACENANKWLWATAEPAVARWGALQ